MAKPTVIEIPKTTSAAADPRAPSILTTLPPETRNRIYEYVFKRDEPVLLREDSAPAEELRHGLFDNLMYRASEQGGENEDFGHDLSGYVGLLLSCRQVYHEAVGILYGQNTFLFSQFLQNQTRSICTWLASIGSHYRLLSRVYIDADGFGIRFTAYDLLPLLKLLWNHPQAKCQFVFASSARLLAQVRNDDPESCDSSPLMTTMNDILFALGTTDSLGLKKYAKYPRLMSSIIVCFGISSFEGGYVQHADSDDMQHILSSRREFDVSDHGSRVQWKESQRLSLLSLPDALLLAINAYASACDTSILFDLNTKKVRGYRVGLSGVNDRLRYDIDQMHTRVYDEVAIQMSTQEATTNFNDFEALQKLLGINSFEELINPFGRRKEHCFINMILIFKLSIPEPTVDLRININKLLHTFQRDYGGLVITVQESDSSVEGTQSIMWHHVQKAVFLLLSDVLERYPSEATRPLPDIWMDGHGTVLRATYRATATSEERIIPYASTSDDPVNMDAQGYRKIKRIHQLEILNDNSGVHPYNYAVIDGVLGMWGSLRNHLWEDWQMTVWPI